MSKEEKVSDIFRKILTNSKRLNLIDFSVKQTTLDEVTKIYLIALLLKLSQFATQSAKDCDPCSKEH